MEPLSGNDRAEIERAADEYLAAMRAEDWPRVAQSFANDGVRTPPHEEPHEGREAIARWLSGIQELSRYELTRERIEGDDRVAFIRGQYAITLLPVGAPGPVSDEGDFLEVWCRDGDGEWRIAEAMWNTRRPPG